MGWYLPFVAVAFVIILWLFRDRSRRSQDRPIVKETDRGSLSRLVRTPGVTAPRSTTLTVPERDNWETEYLGHEEKQFRVECPAWIHYRDGKGQESRREVVVRRLIERKEAGDAIMAFCRTRQADRSFIIDRILEFVNLETGEVISDVSAHLMKAYSESPKGRVDAALTKMAAEASVLIFVARIDGSLRQKQRDVIQAYIQNAEPSTLETTEVLVSAIGQLGSDQQSFRKNLKTVSLKSSDEKAVLLEAIEAIAATRTTQREFTDSALQVASKALGPKASPKPRRPKSVDQLPNEEL